MLGTKLLRSSALPARAQVPCECRRSHAHVLRAVSTQVSERNQLLREGDTERVLVQRQSNKAERSQANIASVLEPYDKAVTADVCVVGCGPAGLALSGELASRGLRVCLVGPETKFTNNYGVWVDEFNDLGLAHLLDNTWQDSVCYFMNQEKRINRAYGRLSRGGIRDHLLAVCKQHGVGYIPAVVDAVDAKPDGGTCTVRTDEGNVISARMINLSGGAVSAKFLQFEDGAPEVAVQTAYGIEAEVEGYDVAYDANSMLFMDYRRTHSGMWANTGAIVESVNEPNTVCHPNWDGNLGTDGEPPSFLYAMPLANGNVFLEETCLVARKPLPFETLKRRLYRRCKTMGITVKRVHEQEWSYIPVGGPMPRPGQSVTAFGAAANLVHPATGYSIARTLKEAAPLADAITDALRRDLPASFHVFGMELLETLDVASIHEFFQTFFALPDYYWRGFLASRLSSTELLMFAFLTFTTCSSNMRARLISHLVFNPAGSYMISVYGKELSDMVNARVRGEPEPALSNQA